MLTQVQSLCAHQRPATIFLVAQPGLLVQPVVVGGAKLTGDAIARVFGTPMESGFVFA